MVLISPLQFYPKGERVKFFKVDFSLIFKNTNLVGVLISPEVYANFLGVLILTIRWRHVRFYDDNFACDMQR
jgi:hypothetical protein